jgi:anaerobic selenocysteine-containing dehydrogenase
MLADYVTPCAWWAERPTFSTYDGSKPWALTGEALVPAVVPGEYERKRDYDFFRELGVRLGQEEYWPEKTLEECYGYRIKGLGYKSFEEWIEKKQYLVVEEEYKKYEQIDPETGEPVGFPTTTGKAELYSTMQERFGYDPLPHYEEPFESPYSTPELAKEYPFVLTTSPRVLPLYHSEHRQIKSLRSLAPDPLVEINTNTALDLGIANGEWVYVETRRGRIRRKAYLTPGIHEKVVQTRQNNWWFPEMPGEDPILFGIFDPGTDNILTDDDPENCDPLCGSWPLRGLLCKVYKCPL